MSDIKKKYSKRSRFKAQFAAVLTLGSWFLTLSTQAQDKKIVVVAGRPMTATDSATVKQLFFSAIGAKTIENTTLATELFERVTQIDPANDASLYELAII